MKITDLVDLLGTESMDNKMLKWFEKYGLGTPPKSVTANQNSKGALDKPHELSYYFTYDIINDAFYPPKNKTKHSYVCYLNSIAVFQYNKKGNLEKPEGFWEDYVHPNSTYKECCAFFGYEPHLSPYSIFFEKSLNAIAEIKVWMTLDKKQVQTIELGIKEAVEFFSIYDFDVNNAYNTIKQAYLLVVKWLFDNRYLLLPEKVYAKGLSFDTETIRKLVSEYLRNHVWDSQLDLDQEPELYKFLFGVMRNSDLDLSDGETINVYVQNLFFKEAGLLEEYYHMLNSEDFDNEDLENFEKSVFLNKKQCESFVNNLTAQFNHYKNNKLKRNE